MSFQLKAVVCGVLALGLVTSAQANLSRSYDVLHDGRIEDSVTIGKSRWRKQLEELIAKIAQPEKKKLELDLTAEDVQKYYDASSALAKAIDDGKKKDESTEDFAKRMKPLIEEASAAAKVILEAIVDAVGTKGGDQIRVQASPEQIEIYFLKTVDKKLEPVGKAVLSLKVKDGDVTEYNLKVYSVKKE